MRKYYKKGKEKMVITDYSSLIPEAKEAIESDGWVEMDEAEASVYKLDKAGVKDA